MKKTIANNLQFFFPRMRLTDEDGLQHATEGSTHYELLIENRQILPFLQTLFFEERLIEVHLDQGTRLFYATLWDHRPELEEQEQDGETVFVEPEYQDGAYLQDMGHLVISPLEPVAGNIKVRLSCAILLSFYTGTNAVELGTKFLRADTIRGESVLLFEYPSIGRIVRNNRPFRAKITPEFEIIAHVCHRDNSENTLDCDIVDISSHGLALSNDCLMEQFEVGDPVALTILSPFNEPIEINGTIRHFAKIRTKKGNINISGVQFDLETRALATLIEELFARVQRSFIRNLAEKTEGQDIHLTLK